jgi:hypothetical protein
MENHDATVTRGMSTTGPYVDVSWPDCDCDWSPRRVSPDQAGREARNHTSWARAHRGD